MTALVQVDQKELIAFFKGLLNATNSKRITLSAKGNSQIVIDLGLLVLFCEIFQKYGIKIVGNLYLQAEGKDATEQAKRLRNALAEIGVE